MPLKVPDVAELEIITAFLTPALTLRLYSNNVTPLDTSIAADFTEVTGGGYANKPITFANWGITGGAPTTAVYNATQLWTFTGATTGPGTIYGYYVTRNSDGKLMWAERFPAANVPFVPENGSKINVLPRFTVESQF